MLSAENRCKQCCSRSGATKHQAWSGSKPFDTMMVILKEIFEKVDFKKKSAGRKKHAKFPSRQKVKTVSNLWNIYISCRKKKMKALYGSWVYDLFGVDYRNYEDYAKTKTESPVHTTVSIIWQLDI